ncbi:HesA/MoeB/ThiF family protein [Kordia algicida OT-1]|uniref:Thiamine biosynthesis protein (HesA/MoeB/ThiF family protein) n=1 Tax=Kordia algicida OT-1 TaxID=391587 RepID=A9DNJ0_9FLAO|nr:HesA/MoeB/ThiF family protein [Kordia algicida]EDP97203.1 thiamine biosynthesis protein (HesA/MoeB/ThiF family protein) [Kordia algicida OT-1]
MTKEEAHIVVVGCGGLGCATALSLTLLGIKKLTIIDDDRVEIDNLQRQILFDLNAVGNYKCDVAKAALEARNKTIEITSVKERVSSKNSKKLLKNATIVVDCTDNYASRLVIDNACAAYNIPMVYTGVKGEEGHISVFNYKGGKSFKATFTNEQEMFQNEDCNDSRVMPQIVTMASSLQVNEVIKIMQNASNVLQGKLQVFNLAKNTFRVFELK